MTRRAPGFSLIEMAFVLIIVTLLLGGLLVPFATQVEQKRIAETNKAMEEIKEALMGFAVANGRLPCPDATNDGLEDPLGGPCAAAAAAVATEGNIPWTTLGIANSDAWGNRFGYRVTNDFAAAGMITLGPPATAGVLQICRDASTPCGSLLANGIPAVIYSLGKNGQSFSCAGPVPANRADECENRDADDIFVSRIITGPGAAVEFDDLVIWLSPNVLFNRMVAAGKLP